MIKVYTAVRMTGRMCDEMYIEAHMLKRVFNNYGFELLNPVLEEKIPNERILLENVPQEKLEYFWRRDKTMIRESDILIDYLTMNNSDGANKEIAYNRWCLWKPTVRVWNGKGALISRIEDDLVVSGLIEAVELVTEKFNTYEKLGQWRMAMLRRSFPRWLDYQRSLMDRYGLDKDLLGDMFYKTPEFGGR